MEATSKRNRTLFAVATSAVGVLLAWFSQEPASLLIAVAAAWVCMGWRAGLAAVVATSLLFAAMLYSPTLQLSSPIAVGDGTVRLTVFALSAFGLWLLLQIFRSVSFFEQVHRVSQPTIEDIPGLGWSAYPDGRLRFVNPAALEFIGISAEEMRRIMDEDHDAWWRHFVHPDDVERNIERWRYSLNTGEPLVDEQRVRRHDGTYRWFRDSAVASRDERGNITGWYGTTVDIDDQRRAEAALRASEQQLRRLIDTVPALIWCADPNGKPSYVNKTLASWSGLSLEEIEAGEESKPASIIVDTVHRDDEGALTEALVHSFSTGEPFAHKYRQRRADGAYRWIDGKAEPLRDTDGSILQWYGVCLDITEEVEAHQAAQASERELRVLVDTVPALIWLITPNGSPHYFNKRFVDWSGVEFGDENSTAGRGQSTLIELIHPDDRPRVAAAFQRSFATGEPLHIKARLRRKDGQYRWVDSRVEPLRDQNGEIIRWYGVSFVIEEEVRAQMALRESQRYLQHLIDTVPVGILLSNPDGEPIYVNKRLMKYHGLDPDELVSFDGQQPVQAIRDLVHPDDRDAVASRLAYCHKVGESFAMRYRQRRSDGVYRWVEGRSEPFRDDDGVIVQWYGVNLDVDDEVRAQESLRLADERLARASRAASLTELSVSIAHELNQPLQAVVSNANAVQRWLHADPPNFERANRSADSIIRNADAAAQVVSRIRAVFTQAGSQRQATNLNTVIKEVCELMADKLLLSNIKLHLDLDPSLPAIIADRVQIEQLVLNLLRNAIEAMQKVDSGRKSLAIVSRWQGKDMLKIEFRDRGSGIDDVERIFDAFYTTKNEGMGMGLSICRSIIETHGGSIWAENAPHGGATIAFSLPIGANDSERVPNSDEAHRHIE
ncbi:PAS domain-containing protein [Pararhizobium sp. BT-229]|uniref:PAS domain-containing sensor histidine kinase n=1 Tax=Pararhizobium sp. BT-229 TaxID=2986923 RepID=UPI0021F7A6BB|nr:PAS domain-containing protein [Pararhizobium sp. BT-229]MCV9966744.1 PAS domain-containing protein [Pararhizobium sp. BT-229]